MKVLVHCCCGPCASASVPELKRLGHEVTLLFANSNIDTREEFERRLGEAEKLAAAENVAIAALDYDHAEWRSLVAEGYEHEPECADRCSRCFAYNLGKTAYYALENGYDAFTSTLSVSPHKSSEKVFAAGEEALSGRVKFLPVDFKKGGGFARSVKRSLELGLYRQNYCGCEFSREKWNLHHKKETRSTNLDAMAGVHRDVFTADFQTDGRGRLDHRWHSPAGAGLLMSVVLSVEGMDPAAVSTLPLTAGLAVAEAIEKLRGGVSSPAVRIKWPNDVLVDGRKLAGILCQRRADDVIVGIGVNVRPCRIDADIPVPPISASEAVGRELKVATVRNAVLDRLWKWYGIWRERSFSAVYPHIAGYDALKGREVSVLKTDSDPDPVSGVSGGIAPDGSLDVGGVKIFAGEVHVQMKEGK